MNAGKIETCKTLQDIHSFLEFKGTSGATTKEIADAVGCENAATWISALRQNGYVIECKYERLTEDGKKVYRYKLLGSRWDAPD